MDSSVPPTLEQNYDFFTPNDIEEREAGQSETRKSRETRETREFREKFTERSNSWETFFSELENFDWVWIAVFLLALFVAARKSVALLYYLIGTEKIYEGTQKIFRGAEKILSLLGLGLVTCDDCPNKPDTIREILRTEVQAPKATDKETPQVKINVSTGNTAMGSVLSNPIVYTMLAGIISIATLSGTISSALRFLSKYLDIFLRFIFKI